MTPLPENLGEYIDNISKNENEDFTQLFSEAHLHVLHSQFYGKVQKKTTEKHSLWMQLKNPRLGSQFGLPTGHTATVNEYLKKSSTNLNNMWRGSLYGKAMEYLTRVLLRLWLAPKREGKTRAIKEKITKQKAGMKAKKAVEKPKGLQERKAWKRRLRKEEKELARLERRLGENIREDERARLTLRATSCKEALDRLTNQLESDPMEVDAACTEDQDDEEVMDSGRGYMMSYP